jgi:signal transduction histidine kinase/ABC-type amino acid transport substrate-binding protein
MSRHFIISAITLLLSITALQSAAGQSTREYTKDRPLIIVSDWEFPPYEFRNDKGEPDGFNVEILNIILDQLKIPHKFIMQEWFQCTQTFESRQADLIHALSVNYRKRPYIMTQNMITYYSVKSVRRPSQKPLRLVSQIQDDDTIMMKKNDYVPLRLQQEFDPQFQIEYRSPKEALTAIRNGRNSYYIWGAIPLQMKIKEYHLDSLMLDDINIPAGELRIIGYDKELIEAIDDAYARMEQSGDLKPIYDKWFYPERAKEQSSPLSLIILVSAIIIIILSILLSILLRNRLRQAVARYEDINNIMTEALKIGTSFVLEYDIDTDHFRNAYGHMLPDEGMTLKQFASHFDSSSEKEFIKHHQSLVRGYNNDRYFVRQFNFGTRLQPNWHTLEGTAIVEREAKIAHHIVYSLKDITVDLENERINQETGNKYARMFETNVIAMSFYNKDGWLLDINKKMRQLCVFDGEAGQYFRETNMFDTDMVKGVYRRGSHDTLHVCNRMYYPAINIDQHIEIRIRPVIDENDEVRYYIVTARNLDAERDYYLSQRAHDRELSKATETINNYERDLAYLLENSDMFIWHSNLEEKTLTFSRSLRSPEFHEDLEDYLKRMTLEEKEDSLSAISDPVTMSKPFNTIHYFSYTHYKKQPGWYVVSGVPTFDADGKRLGYFGVVREITKLIQAQQRLKMETERAENPGKMKSAFLANMTHEIRTPLNAIVGFSDLLPVVDTAEERMEFIRIIRNNCDMLMRLINDILAASNMEQALAINPKEEDMSKVFDDICQTLSQRVQEPGVEFLKDNPYPSCITVLDKGRVQQVLTNFVTNSVKYTHEGHIKIGYRWERRITLDGASETDGLYFYCEDTGAGIPKEKQASVFERFVKLNDFVQGTGLGLSICQAITDRSNGFIGVTSEGEGHGSTFWMWLPCENRNKKN